MSHRNSRRRLSNVKLTRKYHTQYTGWWIVVCAVNVLVLGAMVSMLYDQIQANMVAPAAGRSLEAISASLRVKTLIIIASFVYSGAILALAVFTAHRLAGPYLGLIRTFKAIKAGDLECRLKFRSYDHLDDVEKAFNEMMDEIRSRVATVQKKTDEPSIPTHLKVAS